MYNDLMAVLSEILQSTDYKIKAIGGIRGTSGVCNSNNLHLCGLAVDINPGDNPDCPAYIKKNDRQVGQFWDVAGDHKITQTEWDLCNKGGQVTNIPQKVIDIFEKHGFYWGGYGWGNPNRSDAMHFEYHKYCYE
ncbi:MAG: hypothetical protein COU29_01380 [Candidatus Magasanikbacteria bacterium CG10_big_fil_rev_8_21_14_0_10_36_32]|uniref:Peptidase M15C domain-containing protein n=1 Tax=Candidatus Magasanikbacteria bacterium CG10_big_fil_rev_8_21_14_0_10_36_32 TaxID=1974646 RepID=A0A2M6W7D4_9BACT|nr:MAG: hypothetical protein COU29_01380 [Candidatus Magasanikbacteria bacterium CG10_big_fil_rev_8_21_14_0_10_36_32]